jgi:hypothetical protein
VDRVRASFEIAYLRGESLVVEQQSRIGKPDGNLGRVLHLDEQIHRAIEIRQHELGLGRGRKCGRAEELARDPRLRGAFELVTARSFGPPAVTAECGVGFLCPGGRLVVTEPPAAGAEGAGRWPRAGLDALGLAGPQRYAAGGVSAAVLTLAAPADDRWPRRTGIVAKRPLWR